MDGEKLGPKSKFRHGGLMQNIVINMCESFITIGWETIETNGEMKMVKFVK